MIAWQRKCTQQLALNYVFLEVLPLLWGFSLDLCVRGTLRPTAPIYLTHKFCNAVASVSSVAHDLVPKSLKLSKEYMCPKFQVSLPMYVCIYIYIQRETHTYLCSYLYVYLYCIYICIYNYIYIYICIYIYPYIYCIYIYLEIDYYI